MISYILDILLSVVNRRKFIKLNKEIFDNNVSIKKKILLIEFNAFHNFHIASSVFTNYLRKKKVAKCMYFIIILYYQVFEF